MPFAKSWVQAQAPVITKPDKQWNPPMKNLPAQISPTTPAEVVDEFLRLVMIPEPATRAVSSAPTCRFAFQVAG